MDIARQGQLHRVENIKTNKREVWVYEKNKRNIFFFLRFFSNEKDLLERGYF